MGYLYRHIRLDKNEPFYIGIGGFDKTEKEFSYRRAYKIYRRNKLETHGSSSDIGMEETNQIENPN